MITDTSGIADPAAGLTPTDDDVAANTIASARLFLRQALAAWGETVYATTWASFDEAQAEAATITERIGLELDYVTGQAEYQALVDLRGALAAYLASQATRLPRLVEHQVTAPRSILELAQRYHGDGLRATEIQERNDIIDCAFASGPLRFVGGAG